MIKVFTANDVSPEFVELQVASFRKYLLDDFEFVVFNGGEAIGCYPDKAREVSRICHRLGVRVIDVERDPAVEDVRNERFSYDPEKKFPLFNSEGRYLRGVGGDSFNYMLSWAWANVISRESGPVCFVHSDVFLMEPVSFGEYLKDSDLCTVLTGKGANDKHGVLAYMWEPLLLANMQNLPEPETIVWWPSVVEGEWTDTGGQTYHWLRAHPEIKLLEIGQKAIEGVGVGQLRDGDPAMSFDPPRCQFFWLSKTRTMEGERGDKRIFHYMAGSRWCTDTEYGGWKFSVEQADRYHARKLVWTRKLIGL